ncbi:MAG: AarF/ABC1/UbiB kinase family protein [Deltaproteobacteria bacterium]|nr:AarF/ABC1/UbiB kinase family protein [Deltaproteobacteria bacterium]
MKLFVRLLRAQFVFGVILSSYLWHLALRKVFGRLKRDPESGREQLVLPDWLRRQRRRVDEKNARRMLRGMLRLRGVYIKLGQVLSIMGGFLPRAYIRELESLQDDVPPRPFAEIRHALRRELGADPETIFADFDQQPIAAASLGQVHAAHLEDGRKVAVKVLYPRIRDVVRTDMKVVRLAMKVYRFFVPVQNIEQVHAALVDLLQRETDYLHEAECMRRVGKNFASQDDVVVPEVVDAHTTADVLTMTFMEGIKISRVEELEAAGISRHAVATRLIQSFYEQVFVHRFFHADPHPGNFLVQPGPDPEHPRLVILDFGAISDVSQEMVDGMLDVLRGFFEQNDELVLRGIETIGFVAPGGDRPLLDRTVRTYFQKLLQVEDRTVGAISRARTEELEALMDPEVEGRQLRDLMRSIRYPEGWFYVERASVLLFWLAGTIDPEIDTLQVGFPYVLPLLAQRTATLAGS